MVSTHPSLSALAKRHHPVARPARQHHRARVSAPCGKVPFGVSTTGKQNYTTHNTSKTNVNTSHFSGCAYDGAQGEVLGLWYFRARYFDDTLGRFITRDPLGYVDGYSMYRAYFVPRGMDPYGLWDFIRWLYTGDGNASDKMYDVATGAAADSLLGKNTIRDNEGRVRYEYTSQLLEITPEGKLQVQLGVWGFAEVDAVRETRDGVDVRVAGFSLEGSLSVSGEGLKGKVGAEAHLADITIESPCIENCNGIRIKYIFHFRVLEAQGGLHVTYGPGTAGAGADGQISLVSMEQKLQAVGDEMGVEVSQLTGLLAAGLGAEAGIETDKNGNIVGGGKAKGGAGIVLGGGAKLISAEEVSCD